MSYNHDRLDTLSKNELILVIKSSFEDKKNLQYLLDNLHGISWQLDLVKDKFTYVSSSAKQILGYEVEEWTDINSWKMMIHEDDRDKASQYCMAEIKEGNDHTFEYRMIKKNAETIWVVDIVRLVKNENECPIILHGFILDITQRKNAQLKIEEEHKFLQTVINGISDPVMIINEDYSVKIMNKTVRKTLEKRTFIDPNSPTCYEISHYRDTPCEGTNHPCPLKEVIECGEQIKVVHNHKNVNGNDHFVELAASPLFDENNKCIGIIELASDITPYLKLTKDLEEKSRLLEYEATHDYLTGLPNRALFMDRLEQSIKDANRNKSSLTLFFMDLDHFKQVNDTLGHAMGDSVLKAVCKKFESSTRANDILSRLAGDEFTLILKDVKEKKDIEVIAQKFIDAFQTPLIIDGHSLKLSVSIGISIYSNNTKSLKKLLQKADAAMYEAKADGKSRFKFSS